jgi:hypothetical protein
MLIENKRLILELGSTMSTTETANRQLKALCDCVSISCCRDDKRSLTVRSRHRGLTPNDGQILAAEARPGQLGLQTN